MIDRSRWTGLFVGLMAAALGSGCDSQTHEGGDSTPGPAGGKADGAEDAGVQGAFEGAPYARMSAADHIESQPARFAPHPTSDDDGISLRIVEDGRDVVQRREDGETWTANPFFTVTTDTDVRVDWLREQVVLAGIERSRAPGCCGTGHGTLSAAVFDSSQDAGSWIQRTRRTFVDDRVVFSALALDAEGEPHLAYLRDTSDSNSAKTVTYADCTGTQACAYESIAELSEGGGAVGLVLGSEGAHQALLAFEHDLLVYARQLDGGWAPDHVIDADLRIERLIVEQGYGRAVVVARGVAHGTDGQVAVFESVEGTWEETRRIEYPWVLNADPSNRSVEARLTAAGLVIGTGACLEHEVDGEARTCTRAGWRIFREADAFSTEQIFVEDARSPAAPVLGVDGDPYGLGTRSQPVGFYPVSGEIRSPAYTYDPIDEGPIGLHGTLITELRVRFPEPWSGEWAGDAQDARTRVDCSLWGDNPGFATLSCSVQIEDPHRSWSVLSKAFTLEMDASMSIVHDTDDTHFTAHVERGDEGVEVFIDDFQVFIDASQPPEGRRARVVDMLPLRIPVETWDD